MENRKSRTTGLSLTVVFLASLGLSGCVTVQPEDQSPSSTAPLTSSPTVDTPAPSPESSESTAAPTSASTPTTAGEFDSTFQRITDAATKKLECLDDDQSGSDDSEDLSISDSDMVLSITGDCDDVVVSGNNLTISVVEVDDLKVRGNNNVIAIQDLDDVQISGSDNVIGWNPVHEDEPDLLDEGSNNTLRHDALASVDLTF